MGQNYAIAPDYGVEPDRYPVPMFKPSIDIVQVRDVLSTHFISPIEDLEPIDVGQMARVFSFAVDGGNYVARFATERTAESIEKDRFVSKRLASTSVPVPPIIHSGSSAGLFYEVAPRTNGAPLLALHGEDNWPVVTSLIETLDSIHQHDVSDTTGFGVFDGEGHGGFPGWQDFLLDVEREGGEGRFKGACITSLKTHSWTASSSIKRTTA
jgi:hygromycin-B 4-O-kinase|tara:strand:- start:320 stop:952 length:633 start_codon:yes stop_codon:yes gene_type:complete